MVAFICELYVGAEIAQPYADNGGYGASFRNSIHLYSYIQRQRSPSAHLVRRRVQRVVRASISVGFVLVVGSELYDYMTAKSHSFILTR